ncbi:MAG: hypothetical protein A3K10_17760 [Bacteroidetes bacterium RIFCSPLOWO2_12_FULL_31_6]|nr:MAG: hypothetical protein A3K10_17760 [Bacteroidetes bacterium RIFCSPLOWO2_12_FULL_31_6]
MKGKVVLKSILTTLNTAAYTALEGVNEIQGKIDETKKEELEGYKRSLQDTIDNKLFSIIQPFA